MIAREYPSIAAELLRPLIELLTLARRHCSGDIEKFLVLLIVVVRTADHPQFRASSQLQLQEAEDPILPTLGTNIRSIAASTGIPRETARRKVSELVDAGWLAWRGSTLCLTVKAYRDLMPVGDAVQRLAEINYRTVLGLIAREVAKGGPQG